MNAITKETNKRNGNGGMMTPDVFFRGVLLALRTYRRRFLAEGPTFYEAFRALLSAAQSEWSTATISACMSENFDPVFGVFHGASEMILSGIRDFILALEGPSLQSASFRIGLEEARRELQELPFADVFQKLAYRMHESMPL